MQSNWYRLCKPTGIAYAILLELPTQSYQNDRIACAIQAVNTLAGCNPTGTAYTIHLEPHMLNSTVQHTQWLPEAALSTLPR